MYQDKLGESLMSVRVDTKYKNAVYLHTYYVQVRYCESETNELPHQDFLQEVGIIEDKLLEILKSVFDDHVVYLGCATFGGSLYLTFASNLDIKWNDFIASQLGTHVETGCYMNDHMGYYQQILYPDFMR